MRRALCLRKSPIGLRLVLLDRVVAQVLLWASETRRPTIDAYRRMRTLQRKMTRVMLPIPRAEGETVWDWRRRHARIIDSHMQEHHLELWCNQWTRRYWEWAGHCARSFHRPLHRALEYRSIEWKRSIRLGTTRRRGQWTGHWGRGRHASWEELVQEFFDAEAAREPWKFAAFTQETHEWNAQGAHFAAWFALKAGFQVGSSS
eukprot:7299738-Alexandrium_andersonii.AAC.1